MAALFHNSAGLLLLGLAERGLDRRTDAGQQLFGCISVLTRGLQFEVLVKGLGGAVRRNHLVTLGGCFPQKINALPVVSSSFGGIGLNCLVESGDGLINLARVGEDCPFVEVIGSRIGRFGGSSGGVLLYRLINLTRFCVSVRQIVVVGADRGFNGDRLLVGRDNLRDLRPGG